MFFQSGQIRGILLGIPGFHFLKAPGGFPSSEVAHNLARIQRSCNKSVHHDIGGAFCAPNNPDAQCMVYLPTFTPKTTQM